MNVKIPYIRFLNILFLYVFDTPGYTIKTAIRWLHRRIQKMADLCIIRVIITKKLRNPGLAVKPCGIGVYCAGGG